jgi:hypothetical protein
MSEINGDGLYVRYGRNEAESASGGLKNNTSGTHEVEFELAHNDFNSQTSALPRTTDSFGVVIPKGARIEEVETIVQTAFTVSTGTLGSATLVLGLKQASDRSTELDHDGFTTAAATATVLGLGTVGTKHFTRVGGTGAGALLGTTLANNGVITVANSTHNTNPLNAGVLKVRIRYFFP